MIVCRHELGGSTPPHDNSNPGHRQTSHDMQLFSDPVVYQQDLPSTDWLLCYKLGYWSLVQRGTGPKVSW